MNMRVFVAATLLISASGFAVNQQSTSRNSNPVVLNAMMDRRQAFTSAAAAALAVTVPTAAFADSAAVQDSLDIDNFLRTGGDAGGNMGVSSQAGKSRPQTGVVFRDGSEVFQDRSGAVAAEILTGTKANPVAVLVSFVSPKWKLETGPVFDVECRDKKTGDGAFLAVTKDVEGKKLGDLPSAFFLERLFDPTGRYSFYGPPTDVKVKSSRMEGNNLRYIELTYSNLSQSTNAEIPRKALLVASIPEGTSNAVMLVGSATASRWRNKGADEDVTKTVESFRAIPAPKTNLKLRAKDRSGFIDFN
eukprot:CAMPEP_0119013942 /NCGR_PEP_ID=MMETSP1176-20130426/9269_1 /TAXON_ID=265551 /ORGANISM="Synedropsis recta cf, Strain CCMP1620" /LENGTH=303 /DNA_ID=CAMNT_0006967071 /DNA_START=45 /DNA_END=956 /DNA_ORIENTATION=+